MVLHPDWTHVVNNAGTGTTIQLGATAGDGGTHVGYVVDYDLIKVPTTGEIMLVTDVNTSTNNITVSRGYAGTTNTSTDGSSTAVEAVVLGPSFKSGSAGTDLNYVTTKQENYYNYTQILRVPVKVTKTADAVKMYGGPERLFQQKKKGIEVMRNAEKMILYGGRNSDSTLERYTMGGLTYWIDSYTSNINGTLSYTELEDELREVFKYGQNRKFAMCSRLVLSAFSQIAKLNGTINIVPKASAFGLQISQWYSPHGSIMITANRQLQGDTYKGYCFLLELEEMKMRVLKGRDIKMETNVQNPADDFYLDVYTWEFGLQFMQEAKHRLLYGITGGAADS